MSLGDHFAPALAAALERAWCSETSASPDWAPAAPAIGQCAVTALVVQDLYGGSLRRALVGGVSHYWNEIGGVDVDLTRQQFIAYCPIDVVSRDRAYVLSFPDTARRYRILRARLDCVDESRANDDV